VWYGSSIADLRLPSEIRAKSCSENGSRQLHSKIRPFQSYYIVPTFRGDLWVTSTREFRYHILALLWNWLKKPSSRWIFKKSGILSRFNFKNCEIRQVKRWVDNLAFKYENNTDGRKLFLVIGKFEFQDSSVCVTRFIGVGNTIRVVNVYSPLHTSSMYYPNLETVFRIFLTIPV